jgi:hypothetical protein
MNLIRGYDYEILTPSRIVVGTFKHVHIDAAGKISLVFQHEGKEWELEVKCQQISSSDYSPRPVYGIKELS